MKQRRAHKQRTPTSMRAVPAAPAREPQPSFEQTFETYRRGDLPGAERQLRHLVTQAPRNAGALHLLGVILYQTGRVDEATRRLEQAVAEAPRNADIRSNFGLVLHAQGRWDAAAVQYREALALQPTFAEAHNNLGNTLQKQEQWAQAQACYERALAWKPGYVEAWTNLGTALNAQGNVSGAIQQYRRALVLNPQSSIAHYNLGNALVALDREDEAWHHFQQTILLDPSDRNARINLGNICHARHRLPEALSWFDQVLALEPEQPMAHFHKGMVHLLAGDYTAGWPHYEYRHLAATNAPGSTFPQPLWRGEPLHGRRLLLHYEQGLGDTLQFLRYVPLLKAAGAQTILLVQPSLRSLVAHSFSEAEIVTDATNLPPFDLHCPLPSLPLAFQTTLANLPTQVPYLAVPDPEHAAAATFPWPTSGLRVGLVLTGNAEHKRNRHRSMPPPACEPILSVEGVHFFSLQTAPLPSTADLDLILDNVAATAAKMLRLDLVITIDTMAAHLAGALGLPTWIMLDHAPDWRWMLDRPDSPWYPTARLFRQPARGDWASVAHEVAHALTTFSRVVER